MDCEDILITEKQNSKDNGYGDDDKKNSKTVWRKLWAGFYESYLLRSPVEVDKTHNTLMMALLFSANSGSGIKYQFASTGCGQRAAKMLGVSPEELARAVTPSPSNERELSGTEALDAFVTGLYSETFNIIAALVNRERAIWYGGARRVRNGTVQRDLQHYRCTRQQVSTVPPTNITPSPSNERELSGTEALEAFVTGLYSETFNIIAALVNRKRAIWYGGARRVRNGTVQRDLQHYRCTRQQESIDLCEDCGVHPATGQSGRGQPHERLQAVFHEAMLVAPRERYAQEGIMLDDGADDETVNPGPMVELLDKAPQNTIVRSSQADLREFQSMYPGSNDDTFLERVMTHYGAPNHTQYLIKKAPHARQFHLQHLQGTNPVLYDVTGWVKASRENPVTKKSLTLLQESQNEEIGRLSSWARGACGVSAWSAAAGDASTLRRASSIRRTLTSEPESTQTTLSDRQIVDDMLLTLDLDVTSYRLGLTQAYV
ncbi:Unconventional myosin-XVIIIa [Operophtera brumata]|uniref:Unconventional myosin-XVIIIa n=1 Tax=Operophtera brumata TaxID=104452 RepID=A0A0L7LUY0_OPEBR|nr:Unconventional myosin-XVIIIa [Operophtera brumata]